MVALLINSLASGGAERVVLNIAKGIYEENQKVILICLIRQNEYTIPDGLNIQYLSNESHFIRGFTLNKVIQFPQMVFRLRRIIKENNIRIIQSHLFSASIINVAAKILGGKHSVQIVNHLHISSEKASKVGGILKIAFLRFAYRRANLLISISKRMRDDINNTILKNKQIDNIVIMNPHDIQGMISKAKEPVENFSFGKEKKYIVTAGRLIKRKKIDILLYAFSKLCKYHPDCELVILGDGVEFSSLTALAKNLGIQEKVYFSGFVDNPYKYIAKSDIFVLTSDSEGLPNALIEAMVCKIPVISSDCLTGPREIIAPDTDYNIQLRGEIEISKYGVLTPVGDIELLCKAIRHVIENYSKFESKANEAFKFVREFSIENIITKYREYLSVK